MRGLPPQSLYIGDRNTSYICLQHLPVDNNTMLGASWFMVDFQEMNLNAKKAFTSISRSMIICFCKLVIGKIIGGGHGKLYVRPTSVCDNSNHYFPIKDIYSGLICQLAVVNIIYIYISFINFIKQPTKPHGIIGQFPNRQKEKNKPMILLMLFSVNYKRIFVNLLLQDISDRSLVWQQ